MASKAYKVSKTVPKKLPSWLVPAAIVGLLIIIMVGLELTNTTHFFHKNTRSTSIIPTMSNKSGGSESSKAAKSTATATSGSKDIGSSPSSSTQTSNGDLIKPYGGFVSNHRPGQNGSPTTEESNCITTPGVSCYIEFTKGNETKKLAAQIVDGSGSTYWTWNIKSAGLSSGSWTITAIASAGGQTKSTVDQINLQVQP
ncbi:MAG TPA: hypothetical protein VLF39_04400 [Candidatus Saccharimonadales bacterium]|nr:hypothetical protein [Candidatus Saccharimonadales bacterium]